MTGEITSGGNVQSLLLKDMYPLEIGTPNMFCYVNLFKDCTALVKAHNLPPVALKEYCYYGMFEGCISLESPVDSEMTSLATGCCKRMYYGCESLTARPVLPKETEDFELPFECYDEMFTGCPEESAEENLDGVTKEAIAE